LAIGKIRGAHEARERFDALVSTIAKQTRKHDKTDALDSLASAIAELGDESGLSRLRDALPSLTYRYQRTSVLTRIAAAHLRLRQPDDAVAAFADAIATLESADGKPAHESYEASRLSGWFDAVRLSQRDAPSVVAALDERGVLARALAIASRI